MISIVYSTHKDNEYNKKFREHLLQSVGLKNVQILEYINHNQYSLSQVYNRGIEESTYDIVVCCHNDIKLEKNWGKSLLEDFSKNPEFGIIGKAGSCYFPETGVYWEKMHQTMVGQVYHHPEGQKKWLSKYSIKSNEIIPVVTIDGLFISFDKTKIKHKFDESIGKFHFYDHLFCVPNFLEGVNIGVTSSFEITHESVGQPNQEFWESREKFVEKWGDKLPIDMKPNKVYFNEIKTKKFKKFKKVAIVIPTKGKVDLLFECMDSFFEFCDNEIFNIFIADTGSSDEEKNEIKNKIQALNNVSLIEYDYYNFAKINNDVVKNHVGDEFEFILFSNNDIKILNDVITGMLSVYEKNKKTGTVGARLHFGDNTIQHNGVFMTYVTKDDRIAVGHHSIRNYFNFNQNISSVFGNTGGLLMIRKNTFELVGYFNENYISCFEDVELNMMCLAKGFENFNNGECVAYHYESQTRNDDPKNMEKLEYDYKNNLLPCVGTYFDKIKSKIKII